MRERVRVCALVCARNLLGAHDLDGYSFAHRGPISAHFSTREAPQRRRIKHEGKARRASTRPSPGAHGREWGRRAVTANNTGARSAAARDAPPVVAAAEE